MVLYSAHVTVSTVITLFRTSLGLMEMDEILVCWRAMYKVLKSCIFSACPSFRLAFDWSL